MLLTDPPDLAPLTPHRVPAARHPWHAVGRGDVGATQALHQGGARRARENRACWVVQLKVRDEPARALRERLMESRVAVDPSRRRRRTPTRNGQRVRRLLRLWEARWKARSG